MNLEYDDKEVQEAAFKWLLAFGSSLVTAKHINDAYAAGDRYHGVALRVAGYIERIPGPHGGLRFTSEGLEHLKCL